MDFEQVPSGGLLFAHHLCCLLRTAHRIAIEARSGQVQRGGDHFTTIGPAAQLELVRCAEHAAHGRDAVGHVEKQHVIDERRRSVRWRHVPVHLGESGDDELAASVDAARAGRHLHRGCRSDLHYPVATDEHGVILERPLAIHWQHGRADECGCGGGVLGGGRRRGRDRRDDNE